MSTLRRRITLQLTPLLDLLLIVIFAQYMEMRNISHQQTQRATQAVVATESAEEALVRDRARLAAVSAAHGTLQASAQQLLAEREKLRAELQQARTERDRLAWLATEALRLPEALVKQTLAADNDEALARVRQEIGNLAEPTAAEAVKHLLLMDQLRRTCDLWEVYIDDANVIHVSHGRDATTFRADTPAEFEQEFLSWTKTLGPPKSVVIVMLSWSDATFRTRRAAQVGLQNATTRIRIDRSGQTLFESLSVGFRPRAAG